MMQDGSPEQPNRPDGSLEQPKRPCYRHPCGICCLVFCLILVASITLIVIAATRGIKPDEPYLEMAVFSDDDNRIAVVEKQWSIGLHLPPLQGWTGRVNPSYRVFTQSNANDTTTDTVVREKDHAQSIYYMNKANYILVNYLRQPWEEYGSYIVSDLNKNKRTKREIELSGTWFQSYYSDQASDAQFSVSIPSRNGAMIVAIGKEIIYERPILTRIKAVFFNATTLETISTTEVITISNIGENSQVAMFWGDGDGEKIDEFVVLDAPQYDISTLKVTISALDGAYAHEPLSEAEAETKLVPSTTSSGVEDKTNCTYLEVDTSANQVEFTYRCD